MNNNPIGILDSGLGGLTVWKEVVKLLPHESIMYIGDSLNTPYGAKSEEDIYRLSKKIVDFLLSKHVKLIVIACNTITVSCLDKLRDDYPDIPIVGTVPVVKTAVERTKNNRIGILSTTRTATSTYQRNLINEFAGGCDVFVHGTDELVPMIEKGEVEGERINLVLKKVLTQFQKEQVGTIALGCTHFPFLKQQMQEILGPEVTILDSGAAIARQVKRVLENNNALTEQKHPTYEFYTTGNPAIAKKLLASKIIEQENAEFSEVNL